MLAFLAENWFFTNVVSQVDLCSTDSESNCNNLTL